MSDFSSEDRPSHQVMNQLRLLGAQATVRVRLLAKADKLNQTDLETLEALVRIENPTAGDLSKLLGLETGAMAGILDRLANRHFIERVRDAQDRRKVNVVPNKPKIVETIKFLYEDLNETVYEVLKSHTAEEAALLLEFLTRLNEESQRNYLSGT